MVNQLGSIFLWDEDRTEFMDKCWVSEWVKPADPTKE